MVGVLKATHHQGLGTTASTSRAAYRRELSLLGGTRVQTATAPCALAASPPQGHRNVERGTGVQQVGGHPQAVEIVAPLPSKSRAAIGARLGRLDTDRHLSPHATRGELEHRGCIDVDQPLRLAKQRIPLGRALLPWR